MFQFQAIDRLSEHLHGYLCTQRYQCTSAVVNTLPKQLKDNLKQPRRIDKIHNYNARPRATRGRNNRRGSLMSDFFLPPWSAINVQRLQCYRKQIRFNDKKHIEIVQSLISFPSSFDHRFQVNAILFWFVDLFFFFSTLKNSNSAEGLLVMNYNRNIRPSSVM